MTLEDLVQSIPRTCMRGKLEVKEWAKRRSKVKELKDIVLSVANDVLGVVTKMLGYDRVMVKCQDGHERLCRIRGKMKRRAWIRLEDVVLVSSWDFQSDKRGDVIWRYKRNQAEWLRSKGYLTMERTTQQSKEYINP